MSFRSLVKIKHIRIYKKKTDLHEYGAGEEEVAPPHSHCCSLLSAFSNIMKVKKNQETKVKKDAHMQTMLQLGQIMLHIFS